MKKNIIVTIAVLIVAVAGWIIFAQTTYQPRIQTGAFVVGQPCDFNQIKSWNPAGTVVNTNGLQCYLYGVGSTTRPGIWIYPNGISEPTFLPKNFDAILFGMTQNWNTYSDPTGHYSFKYPTGWMPMSTKGEPSEVVIPEGDPDTIPPDVVINYYSKEMVESSVDYAEINNSPDDTLLQDDSTGNFFIIEHFDLNGVLAIMIEKMSNINAGGDPYDVTVYIPDLNSYIVINYAKYQTEGLDLPAEMMIKTLQLK